MADLGSKFEAPQVDAMSGEYVLDGQSQTTNAVMIVPPAYFRFDEETAESNPFQKRPEMLGVPAAAIHEMAMKEFRTLVEVLHASGIHVDELPASPHGTECPDAVFPNNWFSLHVGEDGSPVLILYPMKADARRSERQPVAVIERLPHEWREDVSIVDCTGWENAGEFLEGTGSLVLDRVNRIAYAAESPRTVKRAVSRWCDITGYQAVIFHAFDGQGVPVYHTNVVMGIGTDFAAVCLEAVHDAEERQCLIESLASTGKEIVALTLEEMYSFAGNLLELCDVDNTPKIVLSAAAWKILPVEKQVALASHGEILPVTIPVIEGIGGGSARCMLAEAFPKREGAH